MKDITRRYVDAYSVAGGISGYGQSLKAMARLIGGGLFVLTLIVGLAAGAQTNAPGTGFLVDLVLGAGVGMAVGGPLYVAAQGQIIQALLDTAVHTSPLLSLEQKEQLLMPARTLPPEGPAPTAAAPEGPPQIPCPRCGAPVYVTARMCPSCWQPLPR